MERLSANWAKGEDVLIAYLDLLGTKEFYRNISLDQQIEGAGYLIHVLAEELANGFEKQEREQCLYFHMYADSIVLAEKRRGIIADCARKLIERILNIQYRLLQRDMPRLSRALVKRGRYYGMIVSEPQISETHRFANFSLVGGAAIIDMDEDLCGLPMGTYIDGSVIEEAGIGSQRLVEVTDGSGLQWVRPREDFDYLDKLFGGQLKDRDDWVRELIKASGNKAEFTRKIVPWIEALQGRRKSIARRHSRTK